MYYLVEDVINQFEYLKDEILFFTGDNKYITQKEKETVEKFIEFIEYGRYIVNLERNEKGEQMSEDEITKKLIEFDKKANNYNF